MRNPKKEHLVPKGVVSVYLARIFPGILNLLLVLATTTLLDSSDYGYFSIWVALSTGGAFIFFGWISQGIARYSNGKDNLLESNPAVFSFASTITAIVILLAGGPILLAAIENRSIIYAFCLLASTTLYGLHTNIIARFQAKQDFSKYSALEITRSASTVFSCIIFVIFIEKSLIFAIIGYLTGQVIGISLAFVISGQKNKIPHLGMQANNIAKLKEIFKYGAPISIWLGIFATWPAVERFFLGVLSNNPEEVGLYSAEYDLAFRALVFALLPITIILQPRIFKNFAHGDINKTNKLIKIGLIAIISIGLLSSIVYLLAKILFLKNFATFKAVRNQNLLLLCIASTTWQMALLGHKWLECIKRIDLMILLLLVALILISLPTSAILFADLGSAAFAIGSAAGGGFYASTAFLFGKRMAVHQKCEK